MNWNAVRMHEQNILCKSMDKSSKCKILEYKISQNELPNINLQTGHQICTNPEYNISISWMKPTNRNIHQTGSQIC